MPACWPPPAVWCSMARPAAVLPQWYAKSGKTLWTIHGNQAWRGCAMTYMLNGKQYVSIASGNNILTFALK